ncbi:MAG: hypothetical protein M8364_09205 [Methylobacter sp.]|jgi:hypothetical protein|uniref:hypothetical protein n=1 Tax=Methylobacter TaxID=429 RepID=UPI00037D4046|nr:MULTISPECIES: hypothetical protein [Methylobacter]MCL7421065.1 hypothetical protein [Methylobacter sp.]
MFPEIGRVIIVGLMIVLPVGLIYRKAGFHPAWALLVFLPGFGLLLIFLQLAFAPWPNQKDIDGGMKWKRP